MVKVVTYILNNDTALQALLNAKSEGDGYKVFPVVVPQSEKAPYCVVRQTSKELTGKNCNYMYGISVVSYATSYDDVTAINEAVITALTTENTGTINGEEFGYALFANESDDFVKEHNLYAKITSFNVMAG